MQQIFNAHLQKKRFLKTKKFFHWSLCFLALLCTVSLFAKANDGGPGTDCPDPLDCGKCIYQLVLTDAVGDGWDGASILVSINEASPATEYKMTPADGTCLVIDMILNNGAIIDLSYWSGANEVEHGFQLLDAEGNVANDENGTAINFTSNPPANAGNEIRAKVNCPECCDTEEDFIVVVSPADPLHSWKLLNAQGESVAFGNPGATTVVEINATLEGCNDYEMQAFSANNTGWGSSTWSIYTMNSNRGTLVSSGPYEGYYVIASGPSAAFTDQTSDFFTLPCPTTCPDLGGPILADDPTNCLLTVFEPPMIDPLICYPNSCHADGLTTEVCFIDATGNPVTGSGSLAVGMTDVIYKISYADGQITSCTTKVTVVSSMTATLVCNDQVNVSLIDDHDECETCLTADMVLEAPDGICPNDYMVNFLDENDQAIGPCVDASFAKQTLKYNVEHLGTGNSCWGYVTIEDKSPPVIECMDYEVSCTHPFALDESYTHDETFCADTSWLPAAIPGGTAMTPSETILTIPNVGCAPLGEVLNDLNVEVVINHNDLEDLQIELVAPDGVTSVILMDYGTCMDLVSQDLNVTFDDGGEAVTCGMEPGIGGIVLPAFPLAVFDGMAYKDLAGDWQLIVRDNDDNDMDDENVGFGEIVNAKLHMSLGFPQVVNAWDCTLQSVEMINEAVMETNCDQSDWLGARIMRIYAVSYTHLTLPTICSV